MNVTLTAEQMESGKQEGRRRAAAAIARKARDRFKCDPSAVEPQHILGARAEIAVANALGLVWSAKDFEFGPDVGTDIQVRARPGTDGRDLAIKPVDKDEQRYVLVVGTGPTFEVVGWEYGYDCKWPKYQLKKGTFKDLYFVPEHTLRKMSCLKINH